MKNIILPDIVAAGIYNAQIVHKNKTVTPIRKTTMFEIEMPLDNGGISYINDTSHPIVKNTVICAKPGQIRHTRLPFKCYYIHIIVSEGELFDILSSFPSYIKIDGRDEIRKIFIELCEHYSAGISRDELMIQSLILKLIYSLSRHVREEVSYKPRRNNRYVIEDTIEYIKDNLVADLSLEALSKRANFSPIYFHKLFRASTGKNLREFTEDQRIKKAIDLLVSTDMNLTEIAYECGFSSQSYFSYVFKRKTGQAPREYAKSIYMKYEKTP